MKNKDFNELQMSDTLKVLVPQADNLEQFATKINPDPAAVDLYELELKRGTQNVPSKEVLASSYNYNRSSMTQGQGLYQIAQRAERQALKDGLLRFSEQIGISKNALGTMVDYLPNARLGYLNKLIKVALTAIARGSPMITDADIQYIRKIRTLNPEAKETLLTLLSKGGISTMDGFSVNPPPTKSNIPVRDMPEIGTGSYIALRNPGNVYLPITQPEDANDATDRVLRLVQVFDQRIKALQGQLESMLDHADLVRSLPENIVQRTLIKIIEQSTDRHIPYKDLITLANQINSLMGLRRSKYLSSLANPWKHRTARIPTMISPPSACFSLRSMVPLTTNASGNVAFIFSPFLLADPAQAVTSFYVNNNAALVGTAASNFFAGVAVGQVMPASFYVRYRLVSAGLRLYCYPSSNNDNGIAVISTTFEPQTASAPAALSAPAAQFGDFNQIENGYYKQTTTVASRQVQEHLYIPLDESYFDYRGCIPAISDGNFGFSWVGYISGAAPATTIARVEFICNIEALLDNTFTDYLPSEPATEEVDFKNVQVVLQKAKQLEKLEPKSVQELIEAGNEMYGSDDLQLPTPPNKIREVERKLKEETDQFKTVVKDFFPTVPKQKQSDFLSTVMDLVSPIASTIVQTVANSVMPSMPLFGKLY